MTRKNKAITLALISVILLSHCFIYAFAADTDSYIETLEAEVETLEQQTAELKAENKRLTNMLSQYGILVNGLQWENNQLKETANDQKEEEHGGYLGEFELTFYCTEEYDHICGGGGTTALGTQVTAGRSVAVDPSVIPLGTKIYIEGVGVRVAEDTGGSVHGNKIDVAVPLHSEAIQNGRKFGVKVWKA